MSLDCEKEPEAFEKLNQSDSSETENDPIKSIIGNFGRWQLKISIWMALIKFPIAWFQMSIVFLAPPTNFWCMKWSNYENITDGIWKEMISPDDKNIIQVGINKGYCLMKQLPQFLNITSANQTLIECSSYSYNKTLFSSTITSEWDLVCKKQNYADLSQVSLMFGVLIGNIIFGILADKYGRKKILVLCLLLQGVFGILTSISPFFWLFILLRFVLALANGGTMVTSFVICMEVVGGKWRTIVPILYQIPFGFGYALLSGFAYFIRDWRYLHMAISLLSLLYIILYWLIPESPRWLLAVNKQEEALTILDKAAKENQKDLIHVQRAMTNISNNSYKGKNTKISARSLFATKQLQKRSFLLCLNWALAGVTFFAFIQYIGHVSQNLFITVALGGLVSLPGTIICVWLVSNYGRRHTIMYSYLLTAACSLLILAFPKGMYLYDWPRVALSGVGIIGLSVSIPAMYLFTGELFPTVLRNSGVGLSMMFTRLGSMIAPLLVSLQNIANYLPLLIIGIATIIQAILVWPLPETQGKRLPDNIADLEKDEIRRQKS